MPAAEPFQVAAPVDGGAAQVDVLVARVQQQHALPQRLRVLLPHPLRLGSGSCQEIDISGQRHFEFGVNVETSSSKQPLSFDVPVHYHPPNEKQMTTIAGAFDSVHGPTVEHRGPRVLRQPLLQHLGAHHVAAHQSTSTSDSIA